LKGSRTTTAADDAGSFAIQADAKSTLLVTSLGFISAEKKVEGDLVLAIIADDPSVFN
jgi:hypothetical protein